MTDLLQQAFDEASSLSAAEQDQIAQWLIDEIRSEHRWEAAFAKSQGLLGKLAGQALAEHRAGKTQPLNADSL